jgi:hypothetical protein
MLLCITNNLPLALWTGVLAAAPHPLVALGMAAFVIGRRSFPIPTRPSHHHTLADILRGLLVGLCVAFCLLMQRLELVQTFRVLAVATSYVLLVFVQ